MAKDDKGLTPMMKQFFSMKAQHPGALMLLGVVTSMRRMVKMLWSRQEYSVLPLHVVIMVVMATR